MAESILAASGVAEPRREAMSLVMLATERDRTFLYAHPEYALTPAEATTFDSLVKRRAGREPLQYISGVQEFYGLEFEVTPDVLIPRPETEMLVERAIEILRPYDRAQICDVGTGSGCIAISILHELPRVRALGLDMSRKAVSVARRNAAKHNVSDRFELVESELFDSLGSEKFDMIVSNPPYVPARDIRDLQAEVRDFEPQDAFTDRSDGLSILGRIVKQTPQFLTGQGYLLLEIGFDQSEKVVEMFNASQWYPPELFPDLQGIPRLVSARLI